MNFFLSYRIHTTSLCHNCEACNKQFAVRAYYEEHKQMYPNSECTVGDRNQKVVFQFHHVLIAYASNENNFINLKIRMRKLQMFQAPTTSILLCKILRMSINSHPNCYHIRNNIKHICHHSLSNHNRS